MMANSVAQRAMAQARKRNATRLEKLALAAAGIVETHMTHLEGGDADSTGFLQQRPSQGWGPVGESVEKDVDDFLAHAKVYRGKIKDPAALAQAVQRSAFPERYGEVLPQARQILRETRPNGATTPGVGSVQPGRAPSLRRGGESLDAKGAMLDALLDDRKNMSLLDRFQERVASGSYTTITPASVTPGQAPKYQSPQGEARGTTSTGVPLSRIQRQAEKIDEAQVDYLWGGGHQRRIGGKEPVTPLDCSGAVSRLLGINPLVSGQFSKWGKAGRDPDGQFTVWANGEHVLVEIGGHFWGTSKSNPGGGAGWIPRSAISKSYLARFTPRH